MHLVHTCTNIVPSPPQIGSIWPSCTPSTERGKLLLNPLADRHRPTGFCFFDPSECPLHCIGQVILTPNSKAKSFLNERIHGSYRWSPMNSPEQSIRQWWWVVGCSFLRFFFARFRWNTTFASSMGNFPHVSCASLCHHIADSRARVDSSPLMMIFSWISRTVCAVSGDTEQRCKCKILCALSALIVGQHLHSNWNVNALEKMDELLNRAERTINVVIKIKLLTNFTDNWRCSRNVLQKLWCPKLPPPVRSKCCCKRKKATQCVNRVIFRVYLLALYCPWNPVC